MRALAPLVLYLLALAVRLAGGVEGYVSDEGASYYFATVGFAEGVFDAHPILYYLFLKASLALAHLDPRGMVVAHAAASALAAPLAYLVSPWAGVFAAFWPGLVEAGNHARHPGFAAALVAAWAAAWWRGRWYLPLLAHLMALGHFSTQVVLLASLLLMPRREWGRVYGSLAYNPLVVLEGMKALALAFMVGRGEHLPLLPDWPGALDALLAPGALAVVLGGLAGAGLARHPALLVWALAVLLGYALGGRVHGLYMAPVALLFAVGAGLFLEEAARAARERLGERAPFALLLPLLLLLLPAAWQAVEGRQGLRASALREAREPGPVAVRNLGVYNLVLNGYRGGFICGGEKP